MNGAGLIGTRIITFCRDKQGNTTVMSLETHHNLAVYGVFSRDSENALWARKITNSTRSIVEKTCPTQICKSDDFATGKDFRNTTCGLTI